MMKRWQTGLALLAGLLTGCYSGVGRLADRAVQGDVEAQYEYGRLLLLGRKVKKDPAAAVAWFRVAAEQEEDRALAALGVCYQAGLGAGKNEKLAQMYLEQAARLGNSNACCTLFVLDWNRGRKRQAVKRLEQLARSDVPEAQLSLGLFYLTGAYIPRNIDKAVDQFRYAAMAGSPAAALMMAKCYTEGIGVPRQPAVAQGWLQLAAEYAGLGE